MQPGILGAGERSGATARADPGAKEALIGIDIAYTMQQLLVEQRALDGSFAAAKKTDQLFQADVQRLCTRPGKAAVAYLQPAKTPGINKAQLTSGRQRGYQVEGA